MRDGIVRRADAELFPFSVISPVDVSDAPNIARHSSVFPGPDQPCQTDDFSLAYMQVNTVDFAWVEHVLHLEADGADLSQDMGKLLLHPGAQHVLHHFGLIDIRNAVTLHQLTIPHDRNIIADFIQLRQAVRDENNADPILLQLAHQRTADLSRCG